MAFPSENGGHYNNHYTADEAELVDKAKRVHRGTTASAQRALKVLTNLLRATVSCSLRQQCGFTYRIFT